MLKEDIISRVKELVTTVEQSLANHNALLGRLAEAQQILQWMEDFEKRLAEDNT